MSRQDQRSLFFIGLIVLAGGAIAWAGSDGSIGFRGFPLFALCALLAFGINWVVFVHAYAAKTERFFDLTGSFTYVSVIATALALGGPPSAREVLLSVLVVVWAVRLGTFLFARIQGAGSDTRFDQLKASFLRYLLTWTLQGLWVFLTLACALAAITSEGDVPLGWSALLGTSIWLFGFTVEVVADEAKKRFRADPDNQGRFIQGGIWDWSRHPNYFGEITLWTGVALIALPELSGWGYVTLVSPVFVYLLLTRVSGIPILEARSSEKWGQDPDFEAYRERTPILFPRPPRRR